MAATTPPRKRTNCRHRKVGRGSQAYAHWVGAGAVVIGLGAAMATGQGVALADDPASEGSTGEASNSTSTAGPTNTGPSAPVTSNSEPGAPSPGSGDGPTSTVSAQTNTSADTTEEVEEEEDSTEDETTETETGTETETEGDEPEFSEPTAEVIPTTPPTPVGQAATTTTNDSGNESTVAPPAATALAAKSVTAPEPPPATSPLTTSSKTNDAQLDAAITFNTAMAAPTTQTNQPTAVVAETLPGSLTAPVTFASIVTDVLRWFGLPPLADNPLPDTPVPPLFEALWMAVRRFEYTFFNDLPTAILDTRGQDPTTGQIEGTLNALDPDGDQLTYTVTDGPDHGEVEIGPNGSFVYTPGDRIAALGGTDTFTIAISDEVGNPFHLHGPLDALKVFGVNLIGPTTATVTVDVEPVIDAIAIIDIGGTPTDVAVHPNGMYLFISNTEGDASGTGLVYIYNTADNTSYASFGTGRGPSDIAFSSGGKYAYIANADGTVTSYYINTVRDPIDMVGTTPTAVAVHPNGTMVFIVTPEGDASGTGVVHIYNTADNTSYASFGTGRNPTDITFSPDGTNAYIVNTDDGTVTNYHINTVREHINLGGTPTAAAVSPDSTRLFVVDSAANATGHGRLHIIDTAGNNTIAVIGIGRNPSDVAFSPDGTRAYITNTGDGTLTVVNTTTLRVTHTINAGRAPTDVAVSPDGATIYVSNTDGTVVVLPGQVN
jgi:YVTN family beta-propeller protein